VPSKNSCLWLRDTIDEGKDGKTVRILHRRPKLTFRESEELIYLFNLVISASRLCELERDLYIHIGVTAVRVGT